MTADAVPVLLGALALATAIGADLYSALAAAGLVAFAGWVTLPAPLTGLAAPAVWIPLVGLALIQAALVRWRLPDLVWDALHTLARPLAAALAAAAALRLAAPTWLLWSASAAGLLVALHIHLLFLGLRVAAHTAEPDLRSGALTAARSAGAALLGALAFATPQNAAAIAALAILLPLPWARPLWRAARMALLAVARALPPRPRPGSWHPDVQALPDAWRAAVARHTREPESVWAWTPATVARLEGRRLFRPGCLVTTPDALVFVESGRRLRGTALPRGPGRADGRELLETVFVAAERPFILCLDRRGPPGQLILTGTGGSAPGMEHSAYQGVTRG